MNEPRTITMRPSTLLVVIALQVISIAGHVVNLATR